MARYSTYTDEQLVQRLQKHDQQAFGAIYDKYWEKLFAIAYHYSLQVHLSEEIVQDVFMSLWDRRNAVAIQSLSAYLATAVKFAIFAALKKEWRLRQALATSPAGNDVAEPDVYARFLKDYIEGRVNALPEQCRIVYRYSREENLSVHEIAQRMRLSPKTVENHLGRALRVIRGRLKDALVWLLWLLYQAF